MKRFSNLVVVFYVVSTVTHVCFEAETVAVQAQSQTTTTTTIMMGNCADFKRQAVLPGERFIPLGYDACTTCTCEHGRPEMCLSMLCSPPKECKNLIPLDDKCCEFECYDGGKVIPSNVSVSDSKDADTLNATNLGLRLMASTITSFLILALLLFMIHRLRQRRLLLTIRRINGSQVTGLPYGNRRYSFGDDESVGYLTRHDQVDFPPYDDPPPPYTLWKPPESYFPQDEAPPPYEASNNNNATRNHNAINDRNHHIQMMPSLALMEAPANLPYSLYCSYSSQLSHYANSLASQNGLIPSLTQVSLRTNNFQMNDLDLETDSASQRHSVPIHDLNVVGSLTSLNSSQSELNAPHVDAIRSDAIYEDYSAVGMLPPLTPNVVGAASDMSERHLAQLPASQGAAPKWEEGANLERQGATAAAHVPPAADKCHSCSDVVNCWDERRDRMHWKAPDLKRCSLQSGVHFSPDPTLWTGDASETSSSSSPTFERTTMSPTSSDSSSVDYSYGGHLALVRPQATAGVLPRRTHSDNRFDGRKTSLPSLTVMKPTDNQSMTTSLDRTLDTIRLKMSPSRNKKGPGKLRRLLGMRCSAGDLPHDRGSFAGLDNDRHRRHHTQTESVLAAVSSSEHDEILDGEKKMSASMPCESLGLKAERSVWKTPRILYVSDGDVSFCSPPSETKCERGRRANIVARPHKLHMAPRCRPRSYDFADLHTVKHSSLVSASRVVSAAVPSASTYPIKEESTSASGEVTRSDNPPTAADCCCSLSSDRLGSSLDSFACTCSSQASFGSMGSGSTPSREGPASLGSLCSPMSTGDQLGPLPPVESHLAEVREEGQTVSASLSSEQHLKSDRASCSLARSGSVCSETGERRHNRTRQTLDDSRAASSAAIIASSVGELKDITETGAAGEQTVTGCVADRSGALDEVCCSDSVSGSAVASHVRVTLGSFKGSHESYI